MKFVRKRGIACRRGRFRLPAAILSLAVAIAPTFASADVNGWGWRNPQPSAYPLWSVSYSNASTGIAVGAGGSVLTTSDGGSTWIVRDSAISPDIALNFTLWRVRFVDRAHAVAIGGYIDPIGGTVGAGVVHSADGGLTWTNPGDPLANVDFSDAHFSDPLHGTAVGLDFSTFQATISRTSDGGATWDTQAFDQLSFLKAVAFPQSDVGFAVGIDADHGLLLGTTNGGDSWEPMPIDTSNQLNDIEFADARFGVIVGNAGTVFTTTDGGATWAPQETNTSVDLHAVNFTADGTIVATGGDYANEGIVLTSSDGGIGWSPQTFGRSIEGVAFGDAQSGTAVGNGGEMLRTTNGGQTWDSQQKSVSSRALFDVAFVDPRVGTGVGEAGTILRTEDGGRSWIAQASGTNVPLLGVTANDADAAMAVGGDLTSFTHVIVATTNAGTTWNNVTPDDLAVPMISVACPEAGVCTAVGACGKIVHTDNGGATWETQRDLDCQTQPPLEGVHFFDTQDGIAVGAGNILVTSNGGASWVAGPSPLGIEGLHGVTFLDRNNGYIAAGSTAGQGTILHTTNGGLTWDVQRGDIPTNVTSVAFANANDGVAVTLGGDIYQTHDGGANWNIHTAIFSHLWAVAYEENATAVAVGDSNESAVILGFNDRIFANGLDPPESP